jgi:hypothetical protein
MPRGVVSVLKHAFIPQARPGASSPPLGEPTPEQLQLSKLFLQLHLENQLSGWVDKMTEGNCRAGGISGKTMCDRTLKHKEVIRKMLKIDPRLTARRIYVAIKCVLSGRGQEARALSKEYLDHHVSTCHYLENYEARMFVCLCVGWREGREGVCVRVRVRDVCVCV